MSLSGCHQQTLNPPIAAAFQLSKWYVSETDKNHTGVVVWADQKNISKNSLAHGFEVHQQLTQTRNQGQVYLAKGRLKPNDVTLFGLYVF